MLIIFLTITSCNKNDQNKTGSYPEDFFDEGIFVVNEGPFQTGSGSLSFLSYTYDSVANEVFQNVNDEPLGNVVQSIAKINDYIAVVVNNANTIRILQYPNMELLASLIDIEQPRYIQQIYQSYFAVSCWDNSVKIYDIFDFSNTQIISVGTGPEKMLLSENRLFVLNQGGLSIDSSITIINTLSFEIDSTLEVYPKPIGIVQCDNKIWVMCSGHGWNGITNSNDTEGHLLGINPVTLEITDDVSFPNTFQHPEKLISINDETLLFLYKDGVYSFNIQLGILNLDQPLIKNDIFFYGLSYDDEREIINCTDPMNFSERGWLKRYDLSGEILDSLKVGVIPGEMLVL